ncbi:hypothetical protein HF086_007551 [Spodoptera exigua]|uniref:Uncharacterized protein n=1 Tax=Spodoptera exigua TaxID=7107 RepID=A0A922MTF9_SPOEX|nr:hypothetical protein HF086_007551 [Spodoptera exigua]
MKNIYTYILFIIIGTFNPRIETHAQEHVGPTEESLEQEAKSDVDRLFAKIQSVSDFDDNDNKTASKDTDKLSEKIKRIKRSAFGGKQKKIRRNIPSDYVPNADDQNRFYNVMHQLASSHNKSIIKRLNMKKDKKFVDSLRRSFANINSQMYPVEIISDETSRIDDDDDEEETSSEFNNRSLIRYSYDENDSNNFMDSNENRRTTFQTYETSRTSDNLPVSDNLVTFNKLLRRLNQNDDNGRMRIKGKNESDNDPIFLKRFLPNREVHEENLYAVNDDAKENNHKRTIITDTKDDDETQTRRSPETRAGYTQNPDTCKTYNENLVKLWANLSKYLNVTEQPDELALHNIAMIIQAYLEHHTKLLPNTQKPIHPGAIDKVTEIILRIRQTLDDSQVSDAKIIQIIKKYVKPFYGDVENEECEQINEEYLQSSVSSLFKKYQDNIRCSDKNDYSSGNKRLILSHMKDKSSKKSRDSGPLPRSNANVLKPDKSIHHEGESFKDFYKGKVPSHKLSRYRQVPQQNRNPYYQTLKRRIPSRTKKRTTVTRKTFTSNVKTNEKKIKCKKIAIMRLITGLRHVIERFRSLHECQIDNTLRSKYNNNKSPPHYMYAFKYYLEDYEGNHPHRKFLPIDMLTRKNTERAVYESSKTETHKSSHELEKDDLVLDDSYTWIRKQADSDVKIDETNNPISTTSNYLYTNDYLQVPPIYDDYDGLSNTPELINSNNYSNKPLISLIDKKRTLDKENNNKAENKSVSVANRKLETTAKPKRSKDSYGFDLDYYDENHVNDSSEEIFQDLTRLTHADEMPQEKKNEHSFHTYESLSELLKKARDVSLQTPEVAIPIALDNDKGYVELTYLVKYPKMLVYRPQFLVKNIMRYDDFLMTINTFNMTNNDVRLMKIVRHMPDKSAKVLFETEDSEEPLEVRNVNENLNSRRIFWSRNDVLDRRPTARISDNLGSIIDGLRYNELSSTNKNKELFSSDSKTRTEITSESTLHDTSSSELKATTTDLADNILKIDSKFSHLDSAAGSQRDAAKAPYSAFNPKILITNSSSESTSSQGSSNYNDPFHLLPSGNYLKNPHILPSAPSTSKPEQQSLSIRMWDQLKEVIKDKAKELSGKLPSTPSVITSRKHLVLR